MEENKNGLITSVVKVFTDKMKELKPIEAAVVFVALAIIFTFGLIGFTSAIASGVVKLVQVIPAVAAAF